MRRNPINFIERFLNIFRIIFKTYIGFSGMGYLIIASGSRHPQFINIILGSLLGGNLWKILLGMFLDIFGRCNQPSYPFYISIEFIDLIHYILCNFYCLKLHNIVCRENRFYFHKTYFYFRNICILSL
jgi:hypothetical protein